MASSMTVTVMDPRRGLPAKVLALPKIVDGFLRWNGELREVLEVHQTQRGVQVELVA